MIPDALVEIGTGLAPLAVRATVVLGTAALIYHVGLRRSSGAVRHLVLTATALALLLLPAVGTLLPTWTVPLQIGGDTVASLTDRFLTSESQAALPESSRMVAAPIDPTEHGPHLGWGAWFALLYLAGALVVLARLVRGEASVRRLGRAAMEETRRSWTGLLGRLARQAGVRTPVRLLRTGSPVSPMTWGILRPTILLPTEADEWPEGRVRAVLLHELAHVARRDGLARMAGAAVTLLYWFHPAVWWFQRRLRTESEIAADDRVLAAGSGPEDYASDLLEIGRGLMTPAGASAFSIATPSTLEQRITRILDRGLNRSRPRRITVAMTVGASLVFVAVVGATTVGAAPPESPGSAADPERAVVQNQPELQVVPAVRIVDPLSGVRGLLDDLIRERYPQFHAEGLSRDRAIWFAVDRESRIRRSWIGPNLYIDFPDFTALPESQLPEGSPERARAEAEHREREREVLEAHVPDLQIRGTYAVYLGPPGQYYVIHFVTEAEGGARPGRLGRLAGEAVADAILAEMGGDQ